MIANTISYTKALLINISAFFPKLFFQVSNIISPLWTPVPPNQKIDIKSSINKANSLTYIRAIAVLAVILLHSSGELLYHFDAQNPFNIDFVTGVSFYSFLRWATPFFILISGTLMLNPKKFGENTVDFLKKRIKRILVPFAFWAIVYFIYENRYYFLEGKIPHKQLIINRIFFEDAYYHLWFIPMIIGLYFITPFLRVFSKSAKKSDIEYFLGLCFITSGIQNFYPTFFIVKYMGWFSYMGFYVLGHYLSTYSPSLKARKILYISGFIAIFAHGAGTLLVSNWDHAYYNRFFIYICPSVGILTAAFFTYLHHVNWDNMASSFPKINALLLKINELSFGIYFIHVLILDLLKNGYLFQVKIGTNTFFNASVPPYIGVLLTAVFVFFISFNAISILKRIPILQKVLM
jgi:surface polysaccharide O-acyltransferase-like enzyme